MIGIETDLDEIQRMVGGELVGESLPQAPIFYLAYDSRRIYQGQETVFIALDAGKRDGHDFIHQAYQKGVRNFILSRREALPDGCRGLQVENTLQALQTWAAQRRQQHPGTWIGITGSNGKTIVKEWLGEVLSPKWEVGTSPGSFNSQLGVALSLLQIPSSAEVAVIEAGISQPGEMDRLEAMVQPALGVMTHFGDAHAEGFTDRAEKLQEKLRLFQGCRMVFLNGDDQEVRSQMDALNLPYQSIGEGEENHIRLREVRRQSDGAFRLVLVEEGEEVQLKWSQKGAASLENILLVILVSRHLGLSWSEIEARIGELHPVSMRMEMLTDNPEVTILNDAYNADRDSVLNALALLRKSEFQVGHALVLSDLEHQGKEQSRIQRDLLDLALVELNREDITLLGPVYREISQDYPGIKAYPGIDTLLADFDYERFRNKTVLLKGARRYALEQMIPYLSRRASATYFKINLDHLRHNLQEFRSIVGPDTRIMAMVKAFAYGSGDWEVAQALQEEGIDYLAVAYTSAGIELRSRGIVVPILIMNADPEHISQLYQFDLEPAVFGFDFLRRYIEEGRKRQRGGIPIHLEVDTGMSRLGFLASEMPALKKTLTEEPRVQLKSVMSHFSMADEEAGDAFTHRQAETFQALAEELGAALGQKPMRHIANTAGIIRFPDYHFEMVRLGLGLYGTAPVPDSGLNLKELGSLHSVVTQVHDYPEGQSIGYGGSESTRRSSRVATVAIGYADGIRRSLSNGKMSFLVRGQRSPVMGRVCMDMLMLDVTEIEGVETGDEVVLLGAQGDDFISVEEMAAAAGTISYEILVNIGQRVRRVYIRD